MLENKLKGDTVDIVKIRKRENGLKAKVEKFKNRLKT